MKLSGGDVLLRDFEPRDVTAYVQIHADPGFSEHAGPDEGSPEHAEKLCDLFMAWARERPRRDFQLAITLRSTGELVGSCGVRTGEQPPGWAEFGIELAASVRGRGLATRAAGLILGLGFGPLALAGVTASSITENAPIARLLRALGFEERGTRREPGWMDRRGWTRTDWVLSRNTLSL